MELHFTAKFNSKLTCFTTKIFFSGRKKREKRMLDILHKAKAKKKRKILDPGDQRHGNQEKKIKEQKKREREKKRKKKKKSSTKHAGKKLKVRAN